MDVANWWSKIKPKQWNIRPEQLVMLAGGLFFISIIIDAMIPNDIAVDVETARTDRKSVV